MILGWFEDRRRRAPLATPIPDAWLGHLAAHVPHYGRLSPGEQQQLQDAARIFAGEKNWEGCGGLEVTDEMKMAVAGQACLLTLGFPAFLYGSVTAILLYPAAYVAHEKSFRWGAIHEATTVRLGEAWGRGSVVLSWEDARAGGRDAGDGSNLVLHEFAHQLDLLDGFGDGIPPLPDVATERHWREVIADERAQLAREAGRKKATLLDAYGATNDAEFFAVATEVFFERPDDIARHHPRLHEILCRFHRRTPVGAETMGGDGTRRDASGPSRSSRRRTRSRSPGARRRR